MSYTQTKTDVNVEFDSLFSFIEDQADIVDQLYEAGQDIPLTITEAILIPRILSAMAYLADIEIPTYQAGAFLDVNSVALSDELLAQGLLTEAEHSMISHVRCMSNCIKHRSYTGYNVYDEFARENYDVFSQLVSDLETQRRNHVQTN